MFTVPPVKYPDFPLVEEIMNVLASSGRPDLVSVVKEMHRANLLNPNDGSPPVYFASNHE